MPKKRSPRSGPENEQGLVPLAREPREVRALFKALEASPQDQVTLLALADWHEEQEHRPAAECLRWVASEQKAPYRYRREDDLLHHHDTWKEGWYWWASSREKRGWGYPSSAVLPHGLWDKLDHTFNYDPLVFKEYPSIRQALEQLIAVWDEGLVASRRRRKG